MQFTSMTRKFASKQKAFAMDYADAFNLTKDARDAFAQIAKGLLDKVRREKKIPSEYRFWVATNCADVNDELESKGVIKYAFTDERGVRVYTHTPDHPLIKAVLKWHVN